MGYQEYIGINSVKELSAILSHVSPRCVFVVTGKKSYEVSGASELFEDLLSSFEVVHFGDFAPNPSIEDVRKGLELYRQHAVDMMVAVGGGSAMDVAKAINILAAHEDDPEIYVSGKETLSKRGVSLVAVPTTAGTGSEATHFAALYVGKKKYSLAHPYMLPDYAIIDPSLTYSLSSHMTAVTGMDAFGQSIESFWSVQSTEASKTYAEEAITLILTHLVEAVQTGDAGARDAMSRAAHLSGRAINISKTTASHAMSYPFTAHFNVPHGHAVALTLPGVLRYNGDVTNNDVIDSRGSEYVVETMKKLYSLLGAKGKEEAVERIEGMIDEIKLARRLSTFGIGKSNLGVLLEDISEERAGNNPRRFGKEEAQSILTAIL